MARAEGGVGLILSSMQGLDEPVRMAFEVTERTILAGSLRIAPALNRHGVRK